MSITERIGNDEGHVLHHCSRTVICLLCIDYGCDNYVDISGSWFAVLRTLRADVLGVLEGGLFERSPCKPNIGEKIVYADIAGKGNSQVEESSLSSQPWFA